MSPRIQKLRGWCDQRDTQLLNTKHLLQALATSNEFAEDMKGPGYKKGRKSFAWEGETRNSSFELRGKAASRVLVPHILSPAWPGTGGRRQDKVHDCSLANNAVKPNREWGSRSNRWEKYGPLFQLTKIRVATTLMASEDSNNIWNQVSKAFDKELK